jgi:hypothetical protein
VAIGVALPVAARSAPKLSGGPPPVLLLFLRFLSAGENRPIRRRSTFISRHQNGRFASPMIFACEPDMPSPVEQHLYVHETFLFKIGLDRAVPRFEVAFRRNPQFERQEPTSLLRNVGSSYSEELGVEVL